MQRTEVKKIGCDVVIATTQGVHSGQCSLSVDKYGTGYMMPAIENQWYTIDSHKQWDNSQHLYDDVMEWFNDDTPPRDDEGRIIPFPQ